MLTLGINYQMHDSAASIARDGEVLFAVAEERLSRVKHDGRFPIHSIRACLAAARAQAAQLDFVAIGWPNPSRAWRHDLWNLARGNVPGGTRSAVTTTKHFLKLWNQRGGERRFAEAFGPTRATWLHVDHHLAHAVSAYACSGFREAAVVVVDGRGATEATTIWHAKDGRLELAEEVSFPNSLGLFYARFTHHLGFAEYSDEWKVMGLAPYGTAGIDLSEFIVPDVAPYRVHSRALMGRDGASSRAMTRRFGPRREPESEIDDNARNLAFAVQDACERAMLKVVERAVSLTGCRDLCLAGGVALNSKANGRLAVSGQVNHLFVQPAAGDDGVALGAALAPLLRDGGQVPVRKMQSAYLGPGFTDVEIEAALETYKIPFSRPADVAASAADLLAAGKIVGWYQGRMEFGPRALGARSILADPRDGAMKDRVNNAVKFREAWRPFAPSVLAECASDYLEHGQGLEFMVVTSQVRPEQRSVIPAVTHVDGSARPQIVEERTSPLFWRLINEFRRRTGVGVVMNTSFNLRGEAIVNSPTDAIRTFFSSGLDALALGPFLVLK